MLHQGRPVQLATPMEVFSRPADTYVAGFIGAPAMNFLPAELIEGGTAARLHSGEVYRLSGRYAGQAITLGIRPENIALAPAGLPLTVELVEPLADAVTVALDPATLHVFDRTSGVRM
ncbi:MAG: hypothetical protein NVS2B11_18250 [Acetobacteraceae bacterium]